MSASDEFFDDLQSEYDALPTPPEPTLRQRMRARIIDARYRLACWTDPYGER